MFLKLLYLRIENTNNAKSIKFYNERNGKKLL